MFVQISIQSGIAAQNLNLDQVLSKFYEANGIAKMQNTKTIVMTGFITRNDLMPYKITKMRPDKYRLDFQVADLETVQAYDGKTGWYTAPWTGNPNPIRMTEDAAGGMSLKADFDGLLYQWKEKGHSAELIGKDTIEGIESYKIQITRKDGGKEFYFIDSKNFYLQKQSSFRKIREQDVELENFYKDYRTVDGIMFPYTIETKMGGQPYSLVEFETIDLNVPVDEIIFVFPE